MTRKTQSDGNLALESKQCQVITIAATETPENVKLRVAAYVRVSSSSDDQLNSFAAQNRYYTDLIASKENWEQVDIYADEGISGTSAEKRDDFQRLLADCRRALIDRILVKSISRFARNTKECLETVRELKLLGVSVCFEKEHINTAEMSGEMMTTLFAGFAQAESESISGNMRWSYQKRMEAGTFVPASAPYGYRIVDRKYRVVEEEARIVRQIFADYLSGSNIMDITRNLNSKGVPKASEDVSVRWHTSMVRYILTNEKYTGDSLWQKKYTTETFPHKRLRNHGECQKYYAEATHPAIISKNVFAAAQELLESRKDKSIHDKTDHCFAKKIFCGECGARFQRKTIRGKDYWICLTHKNAGTCQMPMIPEPELQAAFLRLYYKLKHQGIAILTEMLRNFQRIRSHRMLWSEDVVTLNRKISDLYSQTQMLGQLKQQGLIDPDIFIQQSNDLAWQLQDTKRKKERLLEQDGDYALKQTQELIEILESKSDNLEFFHADIFDELVDRIIVESNIKIRFRLINGLELHETIGRTVR